MRRRGEKRVEVVPSLSGCVTPFTEKRTPLWCRNQREPLRRWIGRGATWVVFLILSAPNHGDMSSKEQSKVVGEVHPAATAERRGVGTYSSTIRVGEQCGKGSISQFMGMNVAWGGGGVRGIATCLCTLCAGVTSLQLQRGGA